MLMRRNQRCGNVVSAVIMFRFGRHGSVKIEQRGHHVTCVLIGTSGKLAAYNYASSLALEQRLSTSWWIQTEVSKMSE